MIWRWIAGALVPRRAVSVGPLPESVAELTARMKPDGRLQMPRAAALTDAYTARTLRWP